MTTNQCPDCWRSGDERTGCNCLIYGSAELAQLVTDKALTEQQARNIVAQAAIETVTSDTEPLWWREAFPQWKGKR